MSTRRHRGQISGLPKGGQVSGEILGRFGINLICLIVFVAASDHEGSWTGGTQVP